VTNARLLFDNVGAVMVLIMVLGIVVAFLFVFIFGSVAREMDL
jgi:hypothetical protein